MDERSTSGRSRYEEELEKLEASLSRHIATLFGKLKRSVKYDDYGEVASDTREQVFDEFLKSQKICQFSGSWGIRERLHRRTMKVISEYESSLSSRGVSFEEFSGNGVDFEHWVAESLKKFGWNTKVTKGSGDQGVDVIAEIDQRRVAIQCKLYKGSVGNKAVQEVIAGMHHLGLERAAVISSGTFTRGAYELAQSTNVMLLSPYEIEALNKI
jgi:restriction system protein